MAESFDPYHRWLGVPPERQPPHHYDLLGIPLWEESQEVIVHAADKAHSYVRNFQLGEHSEAAKGILSELAAARRCLLNPQLRADYDSQLRARVGAPRPAERKPHESEVPVPPAPARPAPRRRIAETPSPPDEPGFSFEQQLAPLAPSTPPVRTSREEPAPRTSPPPPLAPTLPHRPSDLSLPLIVGVGAFAVVILFAAAHYLLRGHPPEKGGQLIFDWPEELREGLQVEIDADPATIPASGTWRLRAPSGRRHIVARRPGYPIWKVELDVPEAGEARVPAPPWRPSRLVLLWPGEARAGATLFLDGDEASWRDPPWMQDEDQVSVSLPAGRHQVRIVQTDRQFQESVDMLSGDVTRRRVVFPDAPPPAEPAWPIPAKSPLGRRELEVTMFRRPGFVEPFTTAAAARLDAFWGDVKTPTFFQRNKGEPLTLRWTGWLRAPEPGAYRLVVLASDPVQVFLDDKLVLNHTGATCNDATTSAVVFTPQPQALRAEMNAKGFAWATLRWIRPGVQADEAIPPECFFHTAEQAAAAALPVAPAGGGLLGCYYSLVGGRKLLCTRIDPTPEIFSPSMSLPLGIPPGSYQIVWRGTLHPPTKGEYRLVSYAQDSIAVKIGERPLTQLSGVAGSRGEEVVTLPGTPVPIVVTATNRDGPGICALRWVLPADKATPPESLVEAPIDPRYLTPDATLPGLEATPIAPRQRGEWAAKTQAVPGNELVDKTRARLMARYGARIKASMVSPAKFLLTQAKETPPGLDQYALLDEALDRLARQNEPEVQTVLEALELKHGVYRTKASPREAKLGWLRTYKASLASPDDAITLRDSITTLVEEARRDLDEELAGELVDLLERHARGPRPATIPEEVWSQGQARLAALQALLAEDRRAAEAHRAALDRLAKNPADAEANDIVGRWWCYRDRDWIAGLPLLSRGPSSAARKLAEQELSTRRYDAQGMLALADNWWSLAARESPLEGEALRSHAQAWYHRISLSELDAPQKARVESRRRPPEAVLP